MRVLMKTTMAGPFGSRSAGEVADVEDETGATLIEGGYAEAITVEPVADAAAWESSDPSEGASAAQEAIAQLTKANEDLKAENKSLRERAAELDAKVTSLVAGHKPSETATTPTADGQATAPPQRRNPAQRPPRSTKQEASS